MKARTYLRKPFAQNSGYLWFSCLRRAGHVISKFNLRLLKPAGKIHLFTSKPAQTSRKRLGISISILQASAVKAEAWARACGFRKCLLCTSPLTNKSTLLS
ncbi:unnamed protein product [Ixodes pacificus]